MSGAILRNRYYVPFDEKLGTRNNDQVHLPVPEKDRTLARQP